MTDINPAPSQNLSDSSAKQEPPADSGLAARLAASPYGLAVVYWLLFAAGASLFFVFGSRAVDEQAWIRYLTLVAIQLAYSFALVVGVRASYKGPQLWKVMSRTSSVFMIINVLVGISTLGFIY